MNEREVQAQLHPHTGQVEVGPADSDLEAVLRKSLINTRALRRCLVTLSAIAEGDDLPAALAKNTLEELAALMVTPAPNLRPFSTYDHAGPEY